MEIDSTYSVFQALLSVVPKWSILGPILLTVSLMISYCGLKILNYAFFSDDNAISCTEKSLEVVIKSLTSKKT